MVTVHAIDVIVSDPQIRGGKPIIKGTSIRVSDLVASHIYRGLSAEELAQNFALGMGQVYAALAYYFMHKDLIDGQMQAEEESIPGLLAILEAQGKLIHLE